MDGKRCLHTLLEFYNNKFPITVDGNKYYYKDLDEKGTLLFRNYDIHAYVVHELLDNNNKTIKFKDKDLIMWFNLINFACTQQDIEHRNKLLTFIK